MIHEAHTKKGEAKKKCSGVLTEEIKNGKHFFCGDKSVQKTFFGTLIKALFLVPQFFFFLVFRGKKKEKKQRERERFWEIFLFLFSF